MKPQPLHKIRKGIYLATSLLVFQTSDQLVIIILPQFCFPSVCQLGVFGNNRIFAPANTPAVFEPKQLHWSTVRQGAANILARDPGCGCVVYVSQQRLAGVAPCPIIMGAHFVAPSLYC